ncbi:rhomboid family intramembrane serine protease [Sphingomonas sp. GlSt437]|uniref:rhomboid family intramembrane serine protease n=1 Tax=Sphingomonas sp. GlSt437 TaxID=3389970 RepID=UPI003EBE1615
MTTFALAIAGVAIPFVFSPGLFLAGGWQDPAIWLSPVISQFLVSNIVNTVFDLIFLLIAGRFVERSLGAGGLIALFVVGAYAGALARTLLTPWSLIPTAGADAAVFAIIGAYFMLYGVPSVIPVARHYSRVQQIGALALLWLIVQLSFMMASGGMEFSLTIINPLGGLVAGVALARPLLAWRYRKA